MISIELKIGAGKMEQTKTEMQHGDLLIHAINLAMHTCHALALEAGWWHDLKTGERVQRNFGELIALVHSELSEALEGHRKDLMDDKLPHRKMVEVELADAVIRIFDLAGAHDFDLGRAIFEKLAYNQHRLDHKKESRLQDGGKKY